MSKSPAGTGASSRFRSFSLSLFLSLSLFRAQAFVRYLLEKVMDVSNHPLTRSTCAAYLGSFLARSTLVPTQLVQEPQQSTFPPPPASLS